MKEADVSQALATTNISMVDATEAEPSTSETARGIVVSLALGLVLAFGTAFGLEYIDSTVKTPEDVEREFHLPSLAAIPSFSYGDRAGYERHRRLFSRHRRREPTRPADALSDANEAEREGSPESRTIALRAAADAGESELVVAHFPKSILAEAYRVLRTALLLSSADNPPQVLLFTSAQSREGKTVSVMNMAATLAQSGAKVVVVDADLRRPRCHRVLHVSSVPGLVDHLVGHSDLSSCIRGLPVESLGALAHGVPSSTVNASAEGDPEARLITGTIDLIPAGTRPPNPAELIGSTRMSETIQMLRGRYDYVLIDSPPVVPVADGLVLSRMVDGVVMVVRAQATPVALVRDGLAALRRIQANVVGILLNDVDIAGGDYYYYNMGYHSAYEYLDDRVA